MSRQDGELEELRMVSCAALLERLPPPWQLDKAESTKRCLKYRRGTGEIILVTHEGRGWWDPGSTTARGDVFNLVQHLQPGTTFGQVCKLLREFVGIAPSYPLHKRIRKREAPAVPAIEQWAKRRPIWRGSPAWTYLTQARRLPSVVVTAAIAHSTAQARTSFSFRSLRRFTRRRISPRPRCMKPLTCRDPSSGSIAT